MSYKKLAQFKAVIGYVEGLDISHQKKREFAKMLLHPTIDINYQIPSTCKFICPDYLGYTALHFALAEELLDLFKDLIVLPDINFTLKNDKGKTVMHEALGKSYCCETEYWKIKGKFQHPFIDAILSAHITFNNTDNPSDEHGITHFHAAVMTNHVQAVEFFLKNKVSINEAISSINLKELQGYTPLHLAARYCALETAEVLLKYGANVNLTNGKNLTPMHLLIERNMSIMDWTKMGKRASYSQFKEEMETNEKIINLLLENYTNPDNIGLTPFHIACTMQDSKMFENLLGHDMNLKDQVNHNSSNWAGYSALHFAAHFNFDALKLLLKNGANILTKDAEGITPFDLCLQRYEAEDMTYLIANEPDWNNIKLSDDKTSLSDIIIAMKSTNTFEAFMKESGLDINVCIPMNASLWPGYTILHLAVAFPKRKQQIIDLYLESDYDSNQRTQDYNCSEEENALYLQRIQICLNFGADVCIQNARGSTPLHLAFRLQRKNVVCLLLQFHKQSLNPADEGGVSHLHIAVASKNETAVTTLLDANADVSATIKSKIAFSSKSVRIGREVTRHTYYINKGSTPLHIAFLFCNPTAILKKLLEHGADLYARDANDLTPLHRIFAIKRPSFYYETNVSELLDNLKDYSSEAGLTHLHVACLANSKKAVEQLVGNGADVNAAITYEKLSSDDYSKSSGSVDPYKDCSLEPLSFLSGLSGCRPLHFSVMNYNGQEIVKILLEHGADIFAENCRASVPLYNHLNNDIFGFRDSFVEVLKTKSVLQKRLEKETGITMLHLACFTLDSNGIKVLLNKGFDVNVKIQEHSPVLPGCTPLHVALNANFSRAGSDEFKEIIQTLLKFGADVTLLDANQQTPVYMAYQKSLPLELITKMLESQKNVKINPDNAQGFTHFHLACIANAETVIKMFLENGVDVNYQIDYLNDRHEYRGYSPLHLLVAKSSLKMINLLLEHNASVEADDCFGNTPLHIAGMNRSLDRSIFENLISAGANVNAENSYKATPFELLLNNYHRKPVDTMKLFLENGCRINQFNPLSDEGYLPKALFIANGMEREEQESYLTMIVNNASIQEMDNLGRNAIHNVVSFDWDWDVPEYFASVIERIQDLGCDIDSQDLQGRTPLHTAIECHNFRAVRLLLDCGADINILNLNGQTAFTYSLRRFDCVFSADFRIALTLMLQVGLFVNQLNIQAEAGIPGDYLNFDELLLASKTMLETLTQQTIGTSAFRLRDFLSETGIVATYPHMLPEERQIIDEFFLINRGKLRKEFHLWAGILVLQYRKAKARAALILDATASFGILNDYILPDLCCKTILRFLSNHELKSLIAATDVD